MGLHEGVDRRLPVTDSHAQEIDADCLVGLLRLVLGGPLPKPLAGIRGDIT